MPSFEESFRKVVSILGQSGLPFALVGGIAASLYRSERRTTDDIDFALGGTASEEQACAILKGLQLIPTALTKAQLDGGPRFAL